MELRECGEKWEFSVETEEEIVFICHWTITYKRQLLITNQKIVGSLIRN